MEAMLKVHPFMKDSSTEKSFTAFFFAASDQEAQVHPTQNKCLREVPLCKTRLSDFCHAVDTIMTECKDSVVIGVGRAEPNLEIVKQVVKEMKWDHKEVQAVTSREAYDNFIKSGSGYKRRRLHRGIATCKYITKYLCSKTGFWAGLFVSAGMVGGINQYNVLHS